MSEIEALLDERNRIKDQIKLQEMQLERVNEKLSKALANLPDEEYTLSTGEKLKVVRGKNRTYDWSAIQAAVDPAIWNQILEPKRALLDDLIEDGVVPVSVVSKHSVTTDRKPFVREF